MRPVHLNILVIRDDHEEAGVCARVTRMTI